MVMMLSYRDHISYTTDAVLNMVRPQFRDAFNANTGLSQDQFSELVDELGLVGSSQDEVRSDQIRNLLEERGPVFAIVGGLNAVHVNIIIGIRQNCDEPSSAEFLIFDTNNPNNGKPFWETNDDFTRNFNRADPWKFIIHL
jgi:hypothetical protein